MNGANAPHHSFSICQLINSVIFMVFQSRLVDLFHIRADVTANAIFFKKIPTVYCWMNISSWNTNRHHPRCVLRVGFALVVQIGLSEFNVLYSAIWARLNWRWTIRWFICCWNNPFKEFIFFKNEEPKQGNMNTIFDPLTRSYRRPAVCHVQSRSFLPGIVPLFYSLSY